MVEASALATTDYSKTKCILKDAVQGQVVTRFPPEPSGYLHIGHVKAAMMNYHYARMYGGQMILRFDDTNPMNEKIEFVDNILRDLKTLGITPDQVTYSSDHFDMLQGMMKRLIDLGLAYADNTPAEEMKEQRDAGVESAARGNTVEQNRALFDDMLAGRKSDYCIRAKMNMQDKVKCLRDPVFYRCKDIPHHRTGDKYKAYPTYDFTCPIVDSHEGVTHALRTVEYRDRNALYAWVQKQLELRPVVIYDFAKLNLLSTCLSKRKLRWFCENNHVEGWDDPRFPTIQGIMRRGMTAEALKNFMLEQGPSKNTVNMEWDKIWAVNKQILDPAVPRYTCIGKASAVKLTIENGPSPPEARSAELHPKNSIGKKAVMYGRDLLIEREDAKNVQVGEKVTLMKWGNATITRREEAGDSFELFATIDEEDKNFKGTTKLTWICNDPDTTVEVKMVEFDHLINKAKIEEEDDNESIFNRNSRHEDIGIAEGHVKSLSHGSYFQFERRGFYYVDQIQMVNKQMVLHFVPDGKTKGMSILSHSVDAAETAKGKGGAAEAKGNAKQQAGVGADGKLSKKALAKQQKKDAKKEKKAAGAAGGNQEESKGAPAGGKGKKPQQQPVAQVVLPANQDYFDGPAADLWESLLTESQWIGGAKQSQADAEAARLLGGRLPNPRQHPNLYAWASMASRYSEDAKKQWPAGAPLQLPAGGIERKRAEPAAAAQAPSAPVVVSPYFTGACADMWESMLVENKSQWLLGAKLTQADAEAVKEMAGKKPNPKTHPNLFAWAAMTFKMSAAAQAKWPAGELPRPANAVGDQTSQIAALAAKVGKLDALSKESVVSDPIRKVQEQIYEQLLAVRDGFAQTLAASLEQCIGKPAGSAQKSAAEVEVDELRAENKKLQYRVTHLLKTVAEVEAAGK